MAIFNFGFIIKMRREAMGLSQEQLAEGICSVPTLSRIESGGRYPSPANLDALLQRLGYSDTLVSNFADKNDFYLHELKFNIRQAYIDHEYEKSRQLFAEFKENLIQPAMLDDQFVGLFETLLYEDEYTEEEKFKVYDRALRLTFPNYDTHKTYYALTYEEIILLNNIAIYYSRTEKRKIAIDIFYSLKEYYERKVVNTEERLRTQPLVLYNLAKMCAEVNRFDEAIEVGEQCAKICLKSSKVSFLDKTYYTMAYAYALRKKEGDKEKAKDCLVNAYSLAYVLEDHEIMRFVRDFIDDEYPNADFMKIY